MAVVEVLQLEGDDPLRFTVTVREGDSVSQHAVTMTRADFEVLSGGAHPATQCIQAAFRFLLDREPKEAILSRFDISVIARYFPEFRQELADYLAGARS